MAVFTVIGRSVVAELMKAETFFLAVGQGDAQWDSAPVAPDPTATALTAPVGVTRLRDIQFVTPDANGTIDMADASRWSVSQTRTRYIYMEFKLDLADATSSTLRENGIYHGTQIAEGVPPGQFFIGNADVTAYGDLVHVDHFNSIVRDGTLEQQFSFILTF